MKPFSILLIWLRSFSEPITKICFGILIRIFSKRIEIIISLKRDNVIKQNRIKGIFFELKYGFKPIILNIKSEIVENKYDYKISLGSLNRYFFKEKNSNSSDLINFSEDKKKHWGSVLKSKKKNIGLVWSGNFFGPKEPSRSIELKKLDKLIKLDFNYYSFQNEIWDRD